MYKILGGDGKEYGPVSAEQLRQWVLEGRANALTQVKAEGATQWQALSSLPELNDVFAAAGAPPTIGAPSGGVDCGPLPVNEGDYELDVVGCLRRAVDVIKNNAGAIFGATAIYFGIIMLLTVLGIIPLIGWLASIASWIIGGPMMGGLYYVIIRAGRNQNPSAMDLIEGGKKRFLQLFLGQLVMMIFLGLCMLPALVAAVAAVVPAFLHHQSRPPVAGFMVAITLGLLALPLAIWLTTNWLFTLPLVVERQLDFWPAMRTSWRQVSRHWWTVFGLLVVVGLIGLAFVAVFVGLVVMDVFLIPGLPLKLIFGAFLALVYIVGVLLLMPFNMGAIAQAYETIFIPRTTQPGQGA